MKHMYKWVCQQLTGKERYKIYLLPLLFFCQPLVGWSQQNLLEPYRQNTWSEPQFTGFVIDTSSTGHTISSINQSSRDTTKWRTNPYNLVDNTENNFASVRLITEGSLNPSNRIHAEATLKINNGEVYIKETSLSIKLNVTNKGGAIVWNNNDIEFTVETSLDNINFQPLELFDVYIDDDNISLDGLPSSSFQYIRIKSKINSYNVAGNKRVDLNFQKIILTNITPTSVCNLFKPIVNSHNPSVPAELEIVSARSGLISGLPITIGVPYANLNRVIDYNLNSYGSIATGVGINLDAELGVSTRNNSRVYPANTYLGYKVSTVNVLGVSLYSGFQIKTYLGGVLQDSVNMASAGLGVGLINANAQFDIGIITTKPADEVQIIYTPGTVAVGGINIYYPIIKEYCEGQSLDCNTTTLIDQNEHPVEISNKIESSISISAGNGFENLAAIVDGNDTTAANFVSTINVSVDYTAEIIIKKALTPYFGVNHVGFTMKTPGLLNLDLLNNTSIDLYRKDTLVTSQTGAELISANVPLLNGVGQKQFGIVSKDTFDEVRLRIYNPVGVNLVNSLLIYDYFVEPLCNTANTVLPANINCNQIVSFSKPNYPLYIDYEHTLKSGSNYTLLSVGDVNNPQAAIDDDSTTAASITVPVNALGDGTNFGVADAINIYPANTYVAFDVEFPTLLNLSVLSDMKMELYLDDLLVQTESDINSLVGLNPGLLTGVGSDKRKHYSIVSKANFNKAVISFGSISVNLGTINIYGVNISKLCPIDLQCNQTYQLETYNTPVGINYTRTGINGLIGISNGIENAEFVVDTIKDNYAEITTTANVLAGSSLAVKNPIQAFPKGSYAGFVIKNGVSGLLDLDLINAVTIKTYLNNVPQESKSAGNLLNLDLLIKLVGPTHNARPVGFITSKPFDEIVITVVDLLGVAKNMHVYSAFVDTRYAMKADGTYCNFHTQPDFAVTYPGVPTEGNLNNNDNVPEGSIYGPATPNANNPSTGGLTLNPDGSYSFTNTVPGEYNYTVPVCYTNNDINPPVTQCNEEILKITVIDTAELAINNPIVNPDIATIPMATDEADTVIIPVLANDGPGNEGGALDLTSVVVNGQPSKGSATPLPDGTIQYIPNLNASGVDSFWYSVTELPANTTDSAYVKVVIQETTIYPIVISDDYVQVSADQITHVPANQGVLINDYSLNDTIQLFVVPFVDTIADKAILVMNADGSYTVKPLANYYGPVDFSYLATDSINTAQGTLHILIDKSANDTAYYTTPDIAVSYPNIPTTGDVSINDMVPDDAVYSNPTPDANNPTGGSLTLSPDGSYNFTATDPGIYNYDITVCYTTNAINTCVQEQLKITVLDTTVLNNKPVVNHDVATMLGSLTGKDTVTIDVLANDGSGNKGGFIDPNTVIVNNPPANGTINVLPSGDIQYIPNLGFEGVDSFWYTVCEKPANTCDSAMVKVIVQDDANYNIVAGDDYIAVPANKTTTVNADKGLLVNDFILSNASLSIVPQTHNITGVGTVDINADGSYTVTPDANYRGTIHLTYQVTDDTDTATGNLVILVTPPSDFVFVTQPDFAVTYPGITAQGSVHTNDNVPNGTVYTLQPEGTNPSANALTVNPDGSYSFNSITPGIYEYYVEACYSDISIGGTINICQTELLTIHVIDSTLTTINPPIINPDAATMTQSLNGTSNVTIDVLANDGPGNAKGRIDAGSMTISVAPQNGTVTINPDGTITYTPNQNFVGTDTFYYNACEVIWGTPGLCGSTKVEITVQEAAAYTVVANDDYMSVSGNRTTTVPADKGVLVNDYTIGVGTVTAVPNTTTTAAGSFTLEEDGSYTFTPANGFIGPVQLPYQATDGINTVSATLHLFVTIPGKPLPITLTSFDAQEVSCQKVAVMWETSKEDNLSHYDVEVSNDGQSFATVATLQGKNNALGSSYKTLVDQKVATAYYRLKSVDMDGSIAYSKIAVVHMNCNANNIELYPNPTQGSVTLDKLPTNAMIYVLGINGKVLISQKALNSKATLDISDYGAGTYMIRVVDEQSNVQNFKLIKN